MSDVAALVAQADRYAARLMAAATPVGWKETVNVVARAYAEGRRDGYKECARVAGLLEDAETEEPMR